MKRILSVMVLVAAVLLIFGCGDDKYAESGTLIIDAGEAVELVSSGDWVLIDAQKKTSFEQEHVEGAVNIERSDITIELNVANMLAPASQLAEVAGAAGISADSNLVIYDDNKNMDSGRLAWTFMIYSHKGQIKVVSGGLSALKKEDVSMASGKASTSAVSYVAGEFKSEYIIDKEGMLAIVNDPPKNFDIIDVRSDEENSEGTIPGSVHIEYLENVSSDFIYKSVEDIRSLYKNKKIMPEDTVAMYCKTSIRAAQTWAALYNAGYRNIKIYDGAWIEWSSDDSLPVYIPEVTDKVEIEIEDAS